MSPTQLKPIIHGRDHCHDGADPIPCLTSPTGGTFEETVVAISNLLAYWRLGETAAPFADTSGWGPAHSAAPADLTIYGSGTAPTADVTGALADDDDGAVQFNYDGTSTAGGQLLRDTLGAPWRFTDELAEMTVAAWIKVKASAVTRTAHIVGPMSQVAYSPDYMDGWALQVLYPSRQIRFTRGQGADGTTDRNVTTTGGVIADEWTFAVGTWDGSTIRLYMNTELIGEATDTNTVAPNAPIRFGGLGDNAPLLNGAWLYGAVDEAAIWTRALTLDEIKTLYASGIGEAAPAGSRVLVSDGQGGYTWDQVTTSAIEPGADGDTLQTVGGSTVWAPAAGGGGGSPTGPAGGVLAGTYPNPTFAVDMATQAELDALVEWTDTGTGAGGAGGGAWTLLHTLTLAAAGIFDQSSISGSYNDLILVMLLRSNDATSSWQMKLNNDAAGNYIQERIMGQGSTPSASENIALAGGWSPGGLPPSTAPAGLFAVVEMRIYRYASTVHLKHMTLDAFYAASTSGSGNFIRYAYGGLWNSTAAVTRVTVSTFGGGNLAASSELRIYGRL